MSEEAAELLTAPLDFSGYKAAIMEAIVEGTKRYVESEESPTKKTCQSGKQRRIVCPTDLLWPSSTGTIRAESFT